MTSAVGEIKVKRKLGEDGEWILTEHFFLDGREVSRKDYRAAIPEKDGVPMFAGAINDANPWTSDALACHSEQREAIMARNKKHGLNIRYDRMGRPVCTDSGQRKKLLKIEGVHDRNSYYGA